MNLKEKREKKEKETPFESLAETAFYQKRSLLERPPAKTGCLGHGCTDSFIADALILVVGISP